MRSGGSPMPGSDIEAYIEELEDLINSAKSPL